jgi:iron(II)-dependent oxidoreductase
LHWRQDDKGNWFGISLSGPGDLVPEAPVSGIDRHEATAYVNWLSTQGGAWEGAVLQHEYQWESAARLNLIKDRGRVWEWCANPFHPYDQFQPSPDPFCRTEGFEPETGVARGGSIHSQPLQKRIPYRRPASPLTRLHFGGIRAVFPPQGCCT